MRGRAIRCWRQKTIQEIITEIRSPLVITLAAGVKGIGCRGAGKVRNVWLSANWGRRVRVGATQSWAG